MPQPAYIICCALCAEDPFSNSISCAHLVESLQLGPASGKVIRMVPGHRVPFPIGLARVLGTWIRSDDDDPNAAFEIENVAILPGAAEMLLGRVEFSFQENTHQRVLSLFPIPPGLQPGVLYVESRIRRAGDPDWLHRQRYPVLIQAAAVETQPPAPPGQSEPA